MKRIPYLAMVILLYLELLMSVSGDRIMGPAHADSVPVSHAEMDALQAEIEHVKARLDETQKALASLQQKFASRPLRPPRPADAIATVRIAGNPLLGAPAAPLTLIEFSNYQCPYCRRFVENTLPELKRDYIETGKLRYAFRDLPLDQIHPHARKAAEAAHCAGDQGRYWEMHNLLFQNQTALQVESLKKYARHLRTGQSITVACCGMAR